MRCDVNQCLLNTLNFSSSPTTFVGGPNDILTGGAGADTFVLPPNFGANTFKPGTDQLEFSQSIFASVAEVLNDAKQSGSDVVIADDRQDVVTLKNMLLGNLHASDLHLI